MEVVGNEAFLDFVISFLTRETSPVVKKGLLIRVKIVITGQDAYDLYLEWAQK